MRKASNQYYRKWILLSLLIPLVVLWFSDYIDHEMILIIWPSSYMLMAISAGTSTQTAILICLLSVGINVILYLIIGLIFSAMIEIIKQIKKIFKTIIKTIRLD